MFKSRYIFNKEGKFLLTKIMDAKDIEGIRRVVPYIKIKHPQFDYNSHSLFFNTDIIENYKMRYYYHRHVISNTIQLLGNDKRIDNLNSSLVWEESLTKKVYDPMEKYPKDLTCVMVDRMVDYHDQETQESYILEPGEMLLYKKDNIMKFYNNGRGNILFFNFKVIEYGINTA